MRGSKTRFGGSARLAIAATLAAVALAACGSSSKSSSSTSPSTAATTTQGAAATTTTSAGGGATTGATVAVASSKLGNILVDSNGMTLYLWEKDTTADKSSCTGACATAWPPEVVTGTPTYGTGLTASMFSTITRDDGSKQLAVNGHPLYRWMGDKAPGDTNGQDVNDFYVVSSSGEKIGS